MRVEKDFYNWVRKTHKEPVHILHVLYNSYCNPNKRILSIQEFQVFLTAWYATKNSKLMTGCLTTIKFFDSKFAH